MTILGTEAQESQSSVRLSSLTLPCRSVCPFKPLVCVCVPLFLTARRCLAGWRVGHAQVEWMPTHVIMAYRAAMLLRGLCLSLQENVCIAEAWGPWARPQCAGAKCACARASRRRPRGASSARAWSQKPLRPGARQRPQLGAKELMCARRGAGQHVSLGDQAAPSFFDVSRDSRFADSGAFPEVTHFRRCGGSGVAWVARPFSRVVRSDSGKPPSQGDRRATTADDRLRRPLTTDDGRPRLSTAGGEGRSTLADQD